MKIFAHRGASGYAPENTMAAIKRAIDMKVDGIEIDVQITKDGKIILFHDWKVDRVTNGKGFVYELNFDYIKSLDAGSWYSKDFLDEKIPTLEEVLEILPINMMLNIEIKDSARHHSDIDKKIVEILKNYPEKLENIIISSFHHNILKNIQNLDSKLKLAMLTASEIIEVGKYVSESGLNCHSYHAERNLISRKDAQALKEKGVQIFAWTINKEDDLDYLISIGVDGLITDYPDIIKELIATRK